jgi:double-stranded uracil-DNA glycosylase
MHTVTSFPPISNSNAKLLILGSMPGIASLTADQYYAHPRNAFWPIMGAIFNFEALSPYEERIEALKAADVALWDVLAQCERKGSLDSAIKTGSRMPNDFGLFLERHPRICFIAFNGIEAERSFKKHVQANLDLTGLQLIRLPSTSPAHTMPLTQKESAWRTALQSKVDKTR